MKKILISILTHKEYYNILPQVWNAVKLIKIPTGNTVEIIVVTDADEELTPEFSEYVLDNKIRLEIAAINEVELAKFQVNQYVEPTTNWTQARVYKVVQARNVCRQIGINEDFNYWLNIDGDIIPPIDTLEKLLAENKNYISGWAYCKKTGGINIYPNKLRYGEVYYALKVPMYCTLHSRKCFIDCPFDLWDVRLNRTDDEKRMKDIKEKGYKMYVHSGVFCEHILEDTGLPYKPKT